MTRAAVAAAVAASEVYGREAFRCGVDERAARIGMMCAAARGLVTGPHAAPPELAETALGIPAEAVTRWAVFAPTLTDLAGVGDDVVADFRDNARALLGAGP